VLARNVRWYLLKNPELALLEDDPVSVYRLVTTYQSTKTGNRLLMFQVGGGDDHDGDGDNDKKEAGDDDDGGGDGP
jgi:hypothetical protein